ncbi:DUF1080 domain-containing protein [Sphingobacterium corticibacter]|uniref:DUF1080 domain-containing protein n=1 Tax=Sphingobacterium corticibacter TaxID=2171749 RepID=A0A2T8HM27_9SPHI|nr:family 16 glycoside hydrolase [Sphingobacterium corticibacter]PVH26484.1 DUF1080 domain-containing protein [Sphingobacterium corticibacter]
MKRISYILSFLLLHTAVYAQLPTDRTTTTKIADLLMQQPAEKFETFSAAMQELEHFTAAEIATLVKEIEKKNTDITPITYALNSYSYYVMQDGKESQRKVFVEGLGSSLGQLQQQEKKAFVLELLKKVGNNESLAVVAPFLSDDNLVDDATLVLHAIGTPEAVNVLIDGLQNAKSEKQAIAVITALGDLKAKKAEPLIIASLDQYTDATFSRNAYIALSKIAGSASEKLFLDKAAEVGYAYEPTNVASLSLDYAANCLAQGDKKGSEKMINTVLQQTNINQSAVLKGRALALSAVINPAKAKKEILRGIQSSDATYRGIALQLLAEHGTKKESRALIAMLKNASPDVQESLFDFLGKQGEDLYAKPIENSLANSKDSRAKVAALRALVRLNNESATTRMIQEISQVDQEGKEAIKDLLLSTPDPKTVQAVHSALSNSDATTQVILLQFLATRSNEESLQSVLPLLTSTDTIVSKEAYKTLPALASAKDLDTLLSLLNNVSKQDLSQVQHALTISLKARSDKSERIQQLASNISLEDVVHIAYLFPVFASVGDDGALPLVQQALNNTANREIAIKTLANWSEPTALPTLITLSRTKKGESLNVVLSGLVKQVNRSAAKPDQKTLYLKDAFAQAESVAQKRMILQSLQATGTFQALAFAGQYLTDPDLKRTATGTVMNIALDNRTFTGKMVKDMLTQCIINLAGEESAYLSAAIERHLAEMPNKESYVALFNGKDLSGWKGLVEDPIKRNAMSTQELTKKQAAADQDMRSNWTAENGMLVFGGKGDNIATDKQYGDFELLVDWKLDPKGEEPDAGIYLRGTPQVQIWDISRVNVGAQVGSGGLYNNKTHAKDPLKVADNTLGEWNTFKIKMIDDKVWVWLNGEQVVDSTTLENYWDRNQPIFPMEQIELQAHGSKVWYRDIYLKELPRKEVFQVTAAEQQEGFKMLFDGTHLDHWTESTAYEITPEGHLRANPDAKFGKNLYTKEEFGDFVYRFDFKLTPGANNGVGIRAPLDGDAAYVGTEIQILDNDADIYKNLKKHQYHGSAYGIIAAKREGLKPLGEWNTQEIYVKGNHIKVTLNGIVILDGDLAEASKNGTLDGKDHPGLKNKKGHLGFLGHGSEVFFRNIRIKRL